MSYAMTVAQKDLDEHGRITRGHSVWNVTAFANKRLQSPSRARLVIKIVKTMMSFE